MRMMFSVVLNRPSFAGRMRRWGLQQLKDFILCSIGQDHRKRVWKFYYRYPHYVDGTLYFKRFRLGDDTDVALIRDWHLHLVIIPLLELYALLTDEGNNSEADSQSGRGWQET
ncbi:hypothetical protein PIB30_009003 [Stylosanthes scabra]|uniref:Uncharacterized protein n=1 Tax=Stylosanthes scabra TaxID=79078 RepID=A0ABU6T4X1_9FABA|nr:hypothetical protein [Stylosanthes scabra]